MTNKNTFTIRSPKIIIIDPVASRGRPNAPDIPNYPQTDSYFSKFPRYVKIFFFIVFTKTNTKLLLPNILNRYKGGKIYIKKMIFVLCPGPSINIIMGPSPPIFFFAGLIHL